MDHGEACDYVRALVLREASTAAWAVGRRLTHEERAEADALATAAIQALVYHGADYAIALDRATLLSTPPL